MLTIQDIAHKLNDHIKLGCNRNFARNVKKVDRHMIEAYFEAILSSENSQVEANFNPQENYMDIDYQGKYSLVDYIAITSIPEEAITQISCEKNGKQLVRVDFKAIDEEAFREIFQLMESIFINRAVPPYLNRYKEIVKRAGRKLSFRNIHLYLIDEIRQNKESGWFSNGPIDKYTIEACIETILEEHGIKANVNIDQEENNLNITSDSNAEELTAAMEKIGLPKSAIKFTN